MAIIAFLGSFPNSQVRPRKVTASQAARNLAVAASPATTLIVPANPNRTALTIKNNGANAIRYGYSLAELNGGGGFILGVDSGIDIEEPGDVFASADGGVSSVSVDEGVG